MNDSRRTGILRLRHLREVNEAKVEEMEAVAPRFAALANNGAAPKVVVARQLFQTPEPLTARLVELLTANRPSIGRVLEPSAGLGRLYRAVRAIHPSAPITMVDISPDCCGELYRITESDTLATLVTGDFLPMNWLRLGGQFDSVVMNPPFHGGALSGDIAHILKASGFLLPGGRLVSICAVGPRQRKALQPIASQWIDLPRGSFKSEGTNVETAIVVIDRPSVHPSE